VFFVVLFIIQIKIHIYFISRHLNGIIIIINYFLAIRVSCNYYKQKKKHKQIKYLFFQQFKLNKKQHIQ
jgi:hypothetical protein